VKWVNLLYLGMGSLLLGMSGLILRSWNPYFSAILPSSVRDPTPIFFIT
jgi:hypothetical protein